MKKLTKVVVLGAVLNRRGELLLTLRNDPKFPDAHKLWDFPGGTNEFGEKLEETLKREVKEETGFSVEVLDMIPKCVTRTWRNRTHTQHTLVFCYRAKLRGGKLKLEDPKISEVRWVKQKELGNFEFISTTKQFLAGL